MAVTWLSPPRKNAEGITTGLDSQRLREEAGGGVVVSAGASIDAVLRSCGPSACSQPNVVVRCFFSPRP